MAKSEGFMDWFKTIIVGVFIVMALWYLFTMTYTLIHPSPQQNITLNVVGLTNANASTLVSLHFECLQVCNKHYYSESFKLFRCWEECEKLGSKCSLPLPAGVESESEPVRPVSRLANCTPIPCEGPQKDSLVQCLNCPDGLYGELI